MMHKEWWMGARRNLKGVQGPEGISFGSFRQWGSKARGLRQGKGGSLSVPGESAAA